MTAPERLSAPPLSRTSQPYFTLLDRIHRHLLPRSYVEIGVSTGTSLAVVLPGTLTVGIDPEPHVSSWVRRWARIFALSSDEFFATRSLADVLEGRPLDLTFIDGMHHFEVALRDFTNLERAAQPQTTVLVHDCYPASEQGAARERTTLGWSGDVWKMIVCLKKWRPDLRVSVVDAGPTGLGVITGLDPSSTVLVDNYDTIVREHMDLPYSLLDGPAKQEVLNRVPDDWGAVRALLPQSPFRRTSASLLRLGRALRPDHWSYVGTRGAYRAKRYLSKHVLEPIRS